MSMLNRDGYIKLALEDTYADGKTPSVSIPVLSGSVKPQIDMKTFNNEIRASRFPAPPATGRQWSEPSFKMNAYPDLVGYALALGLGKASVSAPGAGVKDNVFEPGLTVDNSGSLEISIAGNNPLFVSGYMADVLTFNQGINGEAQMLQVEISGGGKFPTEGALTAFTAPTTTPFQFDECVVSLGGVTVQLDSLSWTHKNGLVIPNHKISGGAAMVQPVLSSQFVGSGQFVLNNASLANFDSWRNQTDLALIITYTSSQVIAGGLVYTLTVTMPKIRLQQPLPDLGSADSLSKEQINFDMYVGTVGASEVPVSYTWRSGVDLS